MTANGVDQRDWGGDRTEQRRAKQIFRRASVRSSPSSQAGEAERPRPNLYFLVPIIRSTTLLLASTTTTTRSTS